MRPKHNPRSYTLERPGFLLFYFRDSRLSDSSPRPHSNQSPFSTAPTQLKLTYLGLQIGSDVLAFLGFTSQIFRTTKGRSHGVDSTYFYARKCPGNAHKKWKEFQITLTLPRYSCGAGELEPSFASCSKHWQIVVHMIDSACPFLLPQLPSAASHPPCRPGSAISSPPSYAAILSLDLDHNHLRSLPAPTLHCCTC